MSDVASHATDLPIRRWPTDRARQWLSSFLDRARRNPNVVAVIAVGSAVRVGVASDDLDVVVLCRDAKQFRERAPIEVDLRRLDLDCVDESIRAGRDLVIWAVRFGRPLLDRDRVWAGIVRNWKDGLPVPDYSVSLERARVTHRRMEADARHR